MRIKPPVFLLWTVGDIDIGQSRFPRSQVAQHTAPAKTDLLVPYHKDILAKVSDDPVILYVWRVIAHEAIFRLLSFSLMFMRFSIPAQAPNAQKSLPQMPCTSRMKRTFPCLEKVEVSW